MIKNYILKFAGFGMAISLLVLALSCTRDYFVDENNSYFYVPQIKERSIENFYISFHDASGNHIRTRFIERPDFEKDTLLEQGVLRFKLPAGLRLKVTCFANLPGADCISVGKALNDSYVVLPPIEGNESFYVTAKDFPVLTHQIDVLPIGHPQSQDRQLIDINESFLFKAGIVLQFKNLPNSVAGIEAIYSGLGTSLCFNGTVKTKGGGDRVVAMHTVSEGTSVEGGYLQFSDAHYPSPGTNIYTGGTIPAGTPELMADIAFKDGEGRRIGSFVVTKEDIQTQLPGFSGYLSPRQVITLEFDQFILVGIKLSGWGDIEPGEPTPL